MFFTTFFDKNYLTRGLVLIESLIKQNIDFKIFILCLDDYVYDFFQSNLFEQVELIKISELEEFDSDLLEAKSNRSIIEYYFTLSPCLPLFLLKKKSLPHICSLDADIKFYASPNEIFGELENKSIVITPHKFTKELKELEVWGKNNVSFQIFKNDQTALDCLEKWRSQCLEWCEDTLDKVNNRFADQKYLDDWEDCYSGKITILNDEVSGLAPWNLNSYKLNFNKNYFQSNNKRLVFYHFHHNKFYLNRWGTNGFYIYKVAYYKILKKLYCEYWSELNQYQLKYQLKKEVNMRFKVKSNLKDLLLEEKTVFLRIFKSVFIFLDFNKLNPIIRKILFRIYA